MIEFNDILEAIMRIHESIVDAEEDAKEENELLNKTNREVLKGELIALYVFLIAWAREGYKTE